MYQKHIGSVVMQLLKQADDMKVSEKISSITIHTSCGPKGPSTYGQLRFRDTLHANSFECDHGNGEHLVTPRKEQAVYEPVTR